MVARRDPNYSMVSNKHTLGLWGFFFFFFFDFSGLVNDATKMAR